MGKGFKKKAIAIKVGSFYWPSKGDANEYYKNILNSYEQGSRLRDDHVGALYALIYMRETPLDKIGPGIDHFYVAENPFYPEYNEFRIKRIDGTIEDISIARTISEYHKYYNENNYYRDVPGDRIPGTTDQFKNDFPELD